MKPVKLGIIGCGIAARELHLPALQKMTDQFQITAVCNHTKPKAKNFAALVGGVDYLLDYRQLLNRSDVEAVDIVLPIHLNDSVTRAALAAGKHVFLEKPLAHSQQHAKKMLTLPTKYAQVMMVAENYRYRPLYHRIKQQLQAGVIGQVYAVDWQIFMYVQPTTNKYAQTQWRIHHQYPGGFITDGGVHNIAAFRLLFGKIQTVSAQVRGVNPGIGELDTLNMHFTTSENIMGNFECFFSANGHSDNRMLIFGRDGTMLIENNRIVIKKEGQSEQTEIIDDDGGFQAEFEDFYQAIRYGKPVFSTFAEAYRDLKIVLTAIKAAAVGKIIHVV